MVDVFNADDKDKNIIILYYFNYLNVFQVY